MNIVTSYPTINLNTANVYTEVARRDNQNRELIPQAKELTAISPEARLLADTEKAKIPGQSVIDNHDALQADATMLKKVERMKVMTGLRKMMKRLNSSKLSKQRSKN